MTIRIKADSKNVPECLKDIWLNAVVDDDLYIVTMNGQTYFVARYKAETASKKYEELSTKVSSTPPLPKDL